MGEDVCGEELNRALLDLMSEFDLNKDGRLELEELSHIMSVEDNFMKAFCVSHVHCIPIRTIGNSFYRQFAYSIL